MTALTFGSLFAGIGGLDLGLERAGMRCVWQVEKDAYCRRVLAKHWPNVTRYEDVRDVGRDQLAPVDVICGGFPCQDISYAGKGAGLAGERSGLWYEYARIIREMEPRYVIVENVAALLTRGLDAILGTLADFGYDAEWSRVSAASVGAPHLRERLFIVAHYDRDGLTRSRLDERQEWRTSADAGGAGEAMADTKGDGRNEGRAESTGQQGRPNATVSRGAIPNAAIIRHNNGRGLEHASRRASPRRFSHWLVEPDVGRVAHGVPARMDRLRGLGNAVVPQVAEVVGRLIVEHADADRHKERHNGTPVLATSIVVPEDDPHECRRSGSNGTDSPVERRGLAGDAVEIPPCCASRARSATETASATAYAPVAYLARGFYLGAGEP